MVPLHAGVGAGDDHAFSVISQAQTSGALTFWTFHSMPWVWKVLSVPPIGQSGADVRIGVDVSNVSALGEGFHQAAVAGDLDHVDDVE